MRQLKKYCERIMFTNVFEKSWWIQGVASYVGFSLVVSFLFCPYQVSSQKFRSKLRKSLFCCFLWQWLISTTDSYGLVVVAGNNQDPGNNQDTVIVPSTNLYQEIAKNSILPVISQNQNGVEIQPLVFQLL